MTDVVIIVGHELMTSRLSRLERHSGAEGRDGADASQLECWLSRQMLLLVLIGVEIAWWERSYVGRY